VVASTCSLLRNKRINKNIVSINKIHHNQDKIVNRDYKRIQSNHRHKVSFISNKRRNQTHK
jgi:hypothetical protein